MITTPTLPPLPKPDIYELGGNKTGYKVAAVEQIQASAFIAGKLAGRPEFYGDGYRAGYAALLQQIADDAYAATFQSVGQYRQALLDQIGKQA